MVRYTLHLLSLPHAKITKDFVHCAFTQKILNMSKMVSEQMPEFDLITYGTVGGQPYWKFVETFSQEDFDRIYPTDHHTNFFDSTNEEGWKLYQKNTIEAINKNRTWKDIILISYWRAHEPIAAATWIPAIEMGIGYPASMKRRHRVFESYAQMYYHYGMENNKVPSQYDVVIPNYFDTSDFSVREKEDYFLFVGRSSWDKWRWILIDLALKMNIKIKFAGQWPEIINKTIKDKWAEHLCEHIGWLNQDNKSHWMWWARAVFVPTLYVEPFAGVQIEALLCGTPIITSDNWVFHETNVHWLTWYRCRTFSDYIWAVENIDKISAYNCKRYAIKNYSLERVGEMYKQYYTKIVDLLEWKWWYSTDYHNDSDILYQKDLPSN